MPQVLVIITGYPATGKTRLSQWLAAEAGLICINKDAIKEPMAEQLGVTNREESRRVGAASYVVMDKVIEAILKSGSNLIIESNFPAEFYTAKIKKLKQKYGFSVLQILCKCAPEVIMERIISRIETGERHAAHQEAVDIESGAYCKAVGNGRIVPLEVEGELIEIDTTDFKRVDYAYLKNAVRKVL